MLSPGGAGGCEPSFRPDGYNAAQSSGEKSFFDSILPGFHLLGQKRATRIEENDDSVKNGDAIENVVSEEEEVDDSLDTTLQDLSYEQPVEDLSTNASETAYEGDDSMPTTPVPNDRLEIVGLKQKSDVSSQPKAESPNPVTGDRNVSKDSRKAFDNDFNDRSPTSSLNDGYFDYGAYKYETLQAQLSRYPKGAERRSAIIETLQNLGVKVFVIDGTKVAGLGDIFKHVRKIGATVAQDNVIEPYMGPVGHLRCLLYQDEEGRLLNLVLPDHTVGPLSKYKDYLDTFSCTQAIIAVMILCRSFPCVSDDDLLVNLKPAYLSLIIGLVLTEEISLSGLNAMMMVRGAPSLSSFYLTSPFGPDIFRKVIILMLLVGSASTGPLRVYLTLAGITGACVALLANMGARAWHFLRWQPVSYSGPGSFIYTYLAAVITGIFLPFMSQRAAAVGGKGAIESIIQSAVLAMLCFAVSGYSEVQKFLVFGSENCDQDLVNIIGSLWWMITFICALSMVKTVPFRDEAPEVGEQFLVEAQTSPVGYRVAQLPDFEIDPNQVLEGRSCFNVQCKYLFGIFVALSIGGAMVANTYVHWGDTVVDTIDKYVGIVREDFGA